MFGALLCVCIIPTVFSIIVKDPPLTGSEYKYSYEIDDPTTGDTKSQHEVRQGDVVRGAYTVLDPDGTKRTVEYTADPENGFTAVIHKESAALKAPQPQQQQQEEPQSQKYVVQEENGYGNYHYKTPNYLAKAVYSAPASDSYSSIYSHAPYYSKSNYEDHEPRVYFTPGNDISSDSDSFGHGQYFSPSHNYYH